MRLLTIYLLLISISVSAQRRNTPVPIAKKPLTHSVYDGWKEIPYKALTPDGNVVAITINPQDGDGEVVFYHLKTNTQDSVKRASEIALTFDSKHS
ncbi:MAG: S9 family peptidase, partial [Cytophagales bacterium]